MGSCRKEYKLNDNDDILLAFSKLSEEAKQRIIDYAVELLIQQECYPEASSCSQD